MFSINSPAAKQALTARFAGLRFDKPGLDAALTITAAMIASGEIATGCPHDCGGAE